MNFVVIKNGNFKIIACDSKDIDLRKVEVNLVDEMQEAEEE